MLPDIAALYIKNGVTRVTGLQISGNGANSGLPRNPKGVTRKNEKNLGLQNSGVFVTPTQPCESGLQKQSYAATRVDTGLAGSVTPVTHVTPFFSNEQLEIAQFHCELIQKEIDTGQSADELHRVNNLAWEFMQVDGMDFETAIRTAAEIVVHCAVASCEASYADVRELWHRLKTFPQSRKEKP